MRANTAVTIRFFIVLSSRFNSRSARELISMMFIDLAGLAQLVDNFDKQTPWLVLRFFGDTSDVKVFLPLLVLFKR
jgi:hypothetical protein